MVVSIRNNTLKAGIIGIWHNSTSIPTDFTEQTSFQNKHIRGHPCGTNPDACVGTSTHTHPTFTGHTHTLSITTFSHNHTITTGGSTVNPTALGASFNNRSAAAHTHTVVSTTVVPAVTNTANPTHSHPALSTDPAHITTRFINFNPTSRSARRQSIPHDITFLWDAPLGCIPVSFGKDAAFLTKYVRGSATIATLAGSNSHSETSFAAHTHTVTIASHTHVPNSNWTSHCGTSPTVPCGTTGLTIGHFHPAGSLTLTAITDSCPSSSDGAHTHSSSDSQPPFREVMYITNTSVTMRRGGLPKDVIALWKDTLASIPTGYSDQSTFFDNFAKAVATLCTATGSTGGAGTHQHGSSGAHTHTSTVTHDHVAGTGVTGIATGSGACCGTAGSAISDNQHVHAYASSDSRNTSPNLNSTGSHQHTSTVNIPSSKTVAFIKRLQP